ncbi:hypothetical protein CLV46_3263 [Diaminobutyricimonas aerilata]|uniref:Uncharacterized protein n=1 Tax=Diaminobutyricimonas aerilata TaxID=1162967 RepID=A0A2M9CP37_9MICO|nr:hypothetical protein CLV46_3263 [Diaminobutyricimonas aerilata]
MTQVTRLLIALAAVCAGLIHLALVVGSPVPIAVFAAAIGTAELAWGLITFVRDRIEAPVVVLSVALFPLVGWAAIVAAGAVSGATEAAALPVLPLGIAAVFDLAIALVIARRLRDGERKVIRTTGAEPSAPRLLIPLFIGSLAAALLVTPALAATEAGAYAQPHGEHDADFVPQKGDPIQLPDEHGH